MRIRVRRLEVDHCRTTVGIAIVRRNHEVQGRIRRDGNRISDVHAHHQRLGRSMIVQVRHIGSIWYQVGIRASAGSAQQVEAQSNVVYVIV